MTIYAPGTPQDAIDADQKRQAEYKSGSAPPDPPPRYNSGGIEVKSSPASGSGSSSSHWVPGGYGYGGTYGSSLPPIPPVYPQRPEGNIGKQVGHMCVSYSNINHEMPHTEYMKMNPAQQKSFHTYGPPMMQAWHPWEPAPAPPAKSAEPCGICRKPGDLKKFEHMNTDWTICLQCSKDAFAAEGVRLWCNGKAA